MSQIESTVNRKPKSAPLINGKNFMFVLFWNSVTQSFLVNTGYWGITHFRFGHFRLTISGWPFQVGPFQVGAISGWAISG